MQVEYSDRGKQNEYDVNRISEEEFESERERSIHTPRHNRRVIRCNVGEHESSLKILRRKHGTQTYHPKSTGPTFERKYQSQINVSVIRERIALPNDNKHI